MPRSRQSVSANPSDLSTVNRLSSSIENANDSSTIESECPSASSQRKSSRANIPRLNYRSIADPTWSQIIERANESETEQSQSFRRPNFRLEYSSILHVDLKRPIEKRELQRKYPQLRNVAHWTVPLCSNFSRIDTPCEHIERYLEGTIFILCTIHCMYYVKLDD